MTTKDFTENFIGTISTEGKELIVEFFISFSRFEYALKVSVVFANPTDKKVEANWDRFASSIKDIFKPEANEELKGAVDFILSQPPKVQSMTNGHLGWRTREFDNNPAISLKLCQHIRDIRNNLFHGGKFNGNFQPDISRNYELLRSAIIILNNWLSLNATVRDKFFEPIPKN